jgi:hypothetical protein
MCRKVYRPEPNMCRLHIKIRPDTLRQNIVCYLRIKHQLKRGVLSWVTSGRMRVELDRLPVLQEVVVFARIFKVFRCIASSVVLATTLIALRQ